MPDTFSIETAPQKCRRKCAMTFRYEHGEAVGGPFPGTGGEPGDVRRCEHGRVWFFVEQKPFDYTLDHWVPLSPFWEPIRYWRAVRVLREGRR